MESLPRSLNYELPQAALHFGAYAQQIFEQSRQNKVGITPTTTLDLAANAISAATPTSATSNLETLSSTASSIVASEFLQKLGASLLNSIHLQNLHKAESGAGSTIGGNMDMEYGSHHVVIDSSNFDAMDELQKQLEYDKLMNEVWIGIVLTLILISMVFCICSCFLYHQFRTWKRNYQSTVMQSQATDAEAMKLSTDMEDPVPEYTLVSGLPSYEAALELLHRTPKSCLLVYPSIFGVFNEKTASGSTEAAHDAVLQQHIAEVTTPLLSPVSATTTTTTTTTNSTHSHVDKSVVATTGTLLLPTYAEACHTSNNNNNNSLTAVTLTAQKSAITTTATTVATTPTTAATVSVIVKSDKC